MDKEITWYVGKGESKDYAIAKGNVIESGRLIPSRNRALDDAFKRNKYCLMTEDDLQEIKMANSMKLAVPISFTSAVREMYDVLRNVPLYLAGVSPTGNLFYYDPAKPLGLKHFCVGSLILVKPNPLRFDKNLRLKEDYDYTLQHIAKYGGVCRLNYLLPRFKHLTNMGGAVSYRTEALEQKTIQQLKKKWGASIRDNPRRPNEILLRIK